MRKDGSAYYPVLEREIILRDLTKKEMRKFLNLEQSSFVLKLNGMRRFSLDEAIQLQENFFPDVSTKTRWTTYLPSWACSPIPTVNTISSPWANMRRR